MKEVWVFMSNYKLDMKMPVVEIGTNQRIVVQISHQAQITYNQP